MIQVVLKDQQMTARDCGVLRIAEEEPDGLSLDPGHYRVTRVDDLGRCYRVFVDDLFPAAALSAGGEERVDGWAFDGLHLSIGLLGPNARETFECSRAFGAYLRPKVQAGLTLVFSVVP